MDGGGQCLLSRGALFPRDCGQEWVLERVRRGNGVISWGCIADLI